MTTRYQAALDAMVNATMKFSDNAREVVAAAEEIQAAANAESTPEHDRIALVAVTKMREVLTALLRDVPNMAEVLTVPFPGAQPREIG